ncbi:Unknown protein sequence [Pseudomonas syringae pv. maculicola]|uniref:Uncharacterized protein n=2 Tax=Pseudomonas savastanoi TaxID=29438 RepID=A0A3M3FKB0_PSESG|nr:Unknown protein sequence [Pseudomonas savastanoi pv. phaseolicola]KPB65587.1 Unknown protein sequence [Pseudomonas amygdali pv. mellea]KPB87719.1 Unknown protein sequence [Pseudomonas syringae pv. maculicola]RMM62317.1 hypothetical protein ALQ74_102608 [Pseudomonas savastanoi pv. glycinea]KPB65198.1 Unknown protein sequence [Pseudomonas savastanoi pv. phaseolicola]
MEALSRASRVLIAAVVLSVRLVAVKNELNSVAVTGASYCMGNSCYFKPSGLCY